MRGTNILVFPQLTDLWVTLSFEKRGEIQEQLSKFKGFIFNPVKDDIFLEKTPSQNAASSVRSDILYQ